MHACVNVNLSKTSSRSTLPEKHSLLLSSASLTLHSVHAGHARRTFSSLFLLECLTMRQKRSGMAMRQQRCAGLDLVMRAVVAIAVLVDVAGKECIESTTKACPSENSDRDVAFWSRPLADVSTCFTETADCRVANGLPRWHSAAPLVILTARSSNAAAVTAAVTFLRSSLSRTGCTAGQNGGGRLSLAKWHVRLRISINKAFVCCQQGLCLLPRSRSLACVRVLETSSLSRTSCSVRVAHRLAHYCSA